MRALIYVLTTLVLAGAARAECVDINADPAERLTSIIHIDYERAGQIIEGRPWPGVRALTGIRGIGRGRIRDILDEGIACTGVRAPRGEREVIEGVVVVLDGDTFEVAGEQVRLIGIDGPEGEQMCRADGYDWPCGQIATAEVYRLVGGQSVSCEVYGRDRWSRALAECFKDGESINAGIVRAGWTLAWYPEPGAVLGPLFS